MSTDTFASERKEQTLHSLCRPSAIMSEAFAHDPKGRSNVCSAMSDLAEEGFFTSLEFLPLLTEKDTSTVRTILEEYDLQTTIWLIPDLNERSLSLSDLASHARRKAVDFVLSTLPMIAASGASFVGVWSGRDPGAEKRHDALQAFEESLLEIGAAAAANNIGTVIEPFDRQAHKKGLIGPAVELAALIQRLPVECNVTACWDTAHLVLGGDDLLESLNTLMPVVSHVHLSNCILEPTHRNYGDWHMALGAPGFLTEKMMRRIMGRLKLAHAAGELKAFSLAAEFRPPPEMSPADALQQCRQWLTEAWELTCED